MRLIIAGSRTVTDYTLVKEAIQCSGFTPITEIVSGGAKGPDRLAEAYAVEANIPVTRFLPEWSRYHRGAGPVRNQAMAEYADALIAIWDGRSKGTEDMIRRAQQCGLQVYVHWPRRSVDDPSDYRVSESPYTPYDAQEVEYESLIQLMLPLRNGRGPCKLAS